MSESAPDTEPGPEAGHDVDGLTTLPGVSSPGGDEKAGTGELDAEGPDPIDVHVASDAYPVHRTPGTLPSRHR